MAINQPEPAKISNETAIAVLNEYPPSKFNLLIPVKTIQEISPMHKVVINQVQINPDPKNGKDVYAEKNGELALTKKGLAKLMAAANIQIIDSRPIMPQKCQRCAEIARATLKALRCGDCPAADDVAYQVTIAVPEPSGTWRIVKATKELRMEDERAAMTEKQFKQFFPYRTEHCETKALNRALREALMISPTYPPQELQKPFAVAYVVPNLEHPEMRKAIATRYAGFTSLFSRPNFEELGAGNGETSEKIIEVSTDEPEEQVQEDNPSSIHVEQAPDEAQDEAQPKNVNVIACSKCGEIVMPTNSHTPEAIRDYSLKRFGRVMCVECQREVAIASRAREAR